MIIYGKNVIKEILINKPNLIIKIFVDIDRHEWLSEYFDSNSDKVYEYKEFDKLKGINTQRIIATIDDPSSLSINDLVLKFKDKKDIKIVILDQVKDPQNFGAIIRNCVAFDVDAIIYQSKNNAPLNQTVFKASAGNWINMDFCMTGSIVNAILTLQKNGFWVAASSLQSNENINILNKYTDDKLAIIIGNEGKGIRNIVEKKSDILFKINISDKVESLNVSSTIALILYEIRNGWQK